MFDVIVVGARVAGASTAMLLARRGHRVLLLDRARFPSDTMSTHVIQEAGVARLHAWGLLDRVAASDCPATTQRRFHFGDFELLGNSLPIGGIACQYSPRRTVLDAILLDAAMEAGVEFREGAIVEDLRFGADGAVAGVSGRTLAGTRFDESATLVIGADGRHSLVARQVGAAIYDAAPARTVQYYSYWSGTGADKVELFFQQRRGATLAPTNDGLAVVVAAWPIEWFKTVRQDVDRHTWSVFDLWPDLAERLRAGRREERFTGTIDVGGFYRTPWGPGWALVGDAGYMKDPITAQGITDAFRDAELLAAAADRGLREPASMLGELQAYERERNALSRGSYRTTCELARLEPPPPDQWRLLHALRGNQQQIDRFFGVTGGTYPARDFYSAENVAEIFAAASTDQPE